MKTINLTITTQEDCNCSYSHDTVSIETYNSIESLLNHYKRDFEDFEAHDHSVNKSACIQIIEDKLTKEYTLLNCDWDYNKGKWGKVNEFDLDLDLPDQEF